MATVTASGGMRLSWRGFATALAVAIFLYLVVRFLSSGIPGVARQPEAKQWAYWLHIAGGCTVMALGPFQFIAPIRNRFRKYHRWAGYTFVAGSVAAFLGYWAVQPVRFDVFRASQTVAITLWMAAMVAAVIAARRKRFLTHQHNMTRAFVLAAYFVVVRLVDPAMGTVGPWLSTNEGAALAHSDWVAWVIPLAAVEVYYGRKWDRLLKRRGERG